MKTIKLLLVAVIVGLSGLIARCQTNYPDAEAIAQAELRFNADHYTESFWSYRNVNGSYQSLNMFALLNQQLYVTNLTINGTNIPLPKPLSGLPIPPDGYQNVNINVNAMDALGNTSAEGQTNYPYLAQGSSVSLVMVPRFPPVAIQLKPGLNRDSINVQVNGANGWGWSYDPNTGLFILEVSGVANGSASYVIKNNDTGETLAHGGVPFFQGTGGPVTDTNSVLSLSSPDGYLRLPLGSNGGNYGSGFQFDSQIIRNGTNMTAKVFGVPDVSYKSGLSIYVGSTEPVTLEIRKWSATGQMTLVPYTIQDNEKGFISVITTGPIDKAVITVIPQGSITGKPFYMGVSRVN